MAMASAAIAGPSSASAADADFAKYWNDGQAEISSYDLTVPFENELRRGVAIAIFSSETFSNSARSRATPGKTQKADEFPAMTFSLAKDFQTGVSNVHEQVSAVIPLVALNGRAAGTVSKVVRSRQDWMGSTYHQLLFDKTTLRSTRHSHADGDQQQELQYPPAATSTDALWFWARQMAEPFVKRGEFRLVPVLTALAANRPPEFKQSNLTRSPVNQRLTIPSGSFDVELCTVNMDGELHKFWVEREFPHRVIRWETSAGERGQLLATERMKHWQLTGKSGEENLRRLKLLARPPRTT